MNSLTVTRKSGVVFFILKLVTNGLIASQVQVAGAEKLIPLTTSRIVGSPDPAPPFEIVREYPSLTLKFIIDYQLEPDRDSFLATQTLNHWRGPSQVVRVSDSAESSESQIVLKSPLLVYGLAFHPNYVENRFLYIFGNGRGRQGRMNRILRYTLPPESESVCDLQSETVILEWKSAGHDGGGIAFGPDGMLYLATGDGSAGSDSDNRGQALDSLCAKVLRIDVDGKLPYAIPPDNPFVRMPGARPETWAYGLRNPWRLCFDSKSGDLWVGNNGQDLWESAYLVRRGANYGWPIREANHPFHPHRQRGPTPILPATVEHAHSESRSLTGGVVYHGDKLNKLRGAYVYGDFSTGKIWGVRHDDHQVVWHNEIADTTIGISGFSIGRQHELIVLDYTGGGIYSLQPAKQKSTKPFPTKLSETGLFESVPDHRLVPAMIPYSINASRWSDGSFAERFLGVPDPRMTEFTSRRCWKFPEGTVLLKTFYLDKASEIVGQRQPIETQILALQQGEWQGYSYQWNDERTDAELVDAKGKDYPIKLPHRAAPSDHATQVWRFPSRAECTVCHNRAVEYVLGITTAQMNLDQDHEGVVINQIDALEQRGLFKTSQNRSQKQLPRLADPFDTSQTLEQRARSYLHVNCHHCHVREGGGNARISLEHSPRVAGNRSFGGRRFWRRRGTQLIGAIPEHGKFGIEDAKIVAAGLPEQSVLFYRMAKLGSGRMPYAGSNVIDIQGLSLIGEWIENLAAGKTDGPDQSGHARQARRLRDQQLQVLIDQEDVPADRIERLLASTSGAIQAMRALEQSKFQSTTREKVIRIASNHPSRSVREIFERFLPPEERVSRLGESFEVSDVLAIEGDFEAGRALFFQAEGIQCKACHKIDGRGGEIGPDLSNIGQNQTKTQLLDSIVNPSKIVDAKFATVRVLTDDGLLRTGIIVSRSDEEIVLRNAQNQTETIRQNTIESMAAQPVSLMPDLLLKELTAQQAADLLAFLSQQQ